MLKMFLIRELSKKVICGKVISKGMLQRHLVALFLVISFRKKLSVLW